jgi:ribosomal protein S18 acetylase RimI-like enzyme
MTPTVMSASPYATTGIDPADVRKGFKSGTHALDDYFARYALPNDSAGIARAYVLRRGETDDEALPEVLGFYTLSMASVAAADVAEAVGAKLPRYPMPVALIGRLAVDTRARARRLGEKLLMDALHRVVDAAALVACIGIIVDAKNQPAADFYDRYDFATVTEDEEWPRRMFLPIEVARLAFAGS